MNPTSDPTPSPAPTTVVPRERGEFRAFLALNPNSLRRSTEGLSQTPFTIDNPTEYEELTGLGFFPELRRLEAVVRIKRSHGFLGNPGSAGSTEYLRFYLSYDEGQTWRDLGQEQFQAHDLPGRPDLARCPEFSVGRTIDTKAPLCLPGNPFARIRAVLSWNLPPPPQSPHWTPPWGNVLETRIQLPMRSLNLGAVLDLTQTQVPQMLRAYLDFDAPVGAAAPRHYTAAELAVEYRGRQVPPHRYALAEAHAILAGRAGTFARPPGTPEATPDPLPFRYDEVFGPLASLRGDTRYEDLTAIAYDAARDELTAIIHVRQSAGYSGGPCAEGSLEWVAFHADLEGDGSFSTHIGTTAVRVHDFETLPGGGLSYAVVLPARLFPHRRPAAEGPRHVPIRAILSWNLDPTPLGPAVLPPWGTRRDTRVRLPAGRAPGPGRQPFLATVSGIATNLIDPATGKAPGERPFGGYLTFGAVIAPATPGLKYRIQVKPHGAPDADYVPVSTPVQLTVAELGAGGFAVTHPRSTPVGPPAEGYFRWEEYGSRLVDGHLAGQWQTGIADHGRLFDVCLFLGVDGNPDHDIPSNVVTVLIDNRCPEAAVSLAPTPGIECLRFSPGEVIQGSFVARDDHFSHFRFLLEPEEPARGTRPSPGTGWTIHAMVASGPGVQTGILDPGIHRDFSLDTSALKPGGYTLFLDVHDRTIVNGGRTAHWTRASASFCVD